NKHKTINIKQLVIQPVSFRVRAPLILKNPPTRRVFAFGSDNNLHEKSLLIKSGGITLATLTRVILLILIS
ncbi:TPA: hypothetical protein HNC35_21775, partial [Escherichia coli]|nr:hypothetical protein [Escherichia coli]